MSSETKRRNDPAYIKHYEAWHNEQWERQFATSAQLENHAITYLTTANGGAAAAAIAFLATAELPHWALYVGLVLFTAGLIACGALIGYGHTQMQRITEGLVSDMQEFWQGPLDGQQMYERNKQRHEDAKLGIVLGWGSFAALIIGIGFSGYALFGHMEQKHAAKAAASPTSKEQVSTRTPTASSVEKPSRTDASRPAASHPVAKP